MPVAPESVYPSWPASRRVTEMSGRPSQPLFMLVWLGSMVTLLAAVSLGFGQMAGADRALLVTAALVYFLGVQLPTVRFNVPLNNELQTVKVDALSVAEQAAVRAGFEPRWNRWNVIRTLFATLAVVLLMVLQVRLAL